MYKMRKLATAFIAVPIYALLAVAQDSGAKNASGMRQSFTGILAAANCSTASIPKITPENSRATMTGSADRSNPTAAQNRARDVNQPPDVDANLDRSTPTQTDRTTPEPAIERKSVERRPDDSKATTTNSTRDLPQATPTNDMAAKGSAGGPDTQSGSGSADRLAHPQSDSDAAGEMTSNTNYANWDKSCFISPSTSTFVLQMQNGRTVRLDDASNQMIVERLQSTGRVQSTNKLLRVRVHGTMDGDVLHITDIQM
jgi:hypothetical protein